MFRFLKNWIIAIVRDISFLLKIILKLFVNVDFNSPITYNTDKQINLNYHFDNIPIFLIHGSSANQYEWKEVEQYIKKYFVNPVYGFTFELDFVYNSESKDIKQILNNTSLLNIKNLANNKNWYIGDYSRKLYDYLDILNYKECILIGHSIGGLIAIEFDRLFPDIATHIFTIVTPIKGSPLLDYKLIRYFFNSKRHMEMRKNSEFIKNIIKHIKNNRNKYYTIGSVNDIHSPNYCSSIDNDHLTISRYGHFSIIQNENVWKYIYTKLRN